MSSNTGPTAGDDALRAGTSDPHDDGHDRDDALTRAAHTARTEAIAVYVEAWESLRWLRAVQAEMLQVQEQAASACRRAQMARVRALGLYVSALGAWLHTEAVLVNSDAAGRQARRLLLLQAGTAGAAAASGSGADEQQQTAPAHAAAGAS